MARSNISKHLSPDDLSVIRGFLLPFYVGAIKALERSKIAIKLDPTSKSLGELEYWQHALKVLRWLLRHADWNSEIPQVEDSEDAFSV